MPDLTQRQQIEATICPDCDGTGQRIVNSGGPAGARRFTVRCDYCNGSGEPPDCKTCRDIHDSRDRFGPSHRGARNCESGSIASGGDRAHCTCDWCW